MKMLFTGFLSVSISGSLIICLTVLLRLIFQKAPKSFICVLWALAILRLLLPFQIESPFSFRPDTPVFTVRDTGLASDWQPVTNTEIPDFIPQISAGDAQTVAVDWLTIAGVCWAVVAVAFLLHTVISYLRLKHRVTDAVRLKKGIYQTDKLNTAILLGFFKPKIYLPVGMEMAEQELVIAHERAHLKRGDNWLKIFGCLCLCIHWFNPLMWIAYVLLCRDIETACDEQVVRELSTEDRKLYSSALLSCGKGKAVIAGCPVAFGEIGIRQRIKNVLHYKKPTLWISIAVVIAIVFTAVFFMTDPVQKYPPRYQQLTSLLGEPLSVVCDKLGCSEDETIPGELSGYVKTPIRVEHLGIPFELHIFMGNNAVVEGLYGFAYVAEYSENYEQAAKDIVTLSRNQWRYFGEGLHTNKYKDLLSYISEEEVLKKIERGRTDDIYDSWDLSESNISVKQYLKELGNSDKWNSYYSSIDLGNQIASATPGFEHSYSVYQESQEQGPDTVIVSLTYRMQRNMSSIPKFVAAYVYEKTWWEKFLDWLK